MANEVLVKNGTPVVWADTTDYSSTNSGYTRTHQILLENLATTRARQGAKADLGATRAARYAVRIGVEFAVAPTIGTQVEVWWSASASGTAGTGNDGGCGGSDADYQASAAEVDEFKRQLTYIGSLFATADATSPPQYATISTDFVPPERYGMPVVVNETNQNLNGTDAIEMFVALIPLIDEIQ